MADHGKQDVQFKKKMGEMRREIRKSVGQLTEGKGANKIPVSQIYCISIIQADDFVDRQNLCGAERGSHKYAQSTRGSWHGSLEKA